jgi:predicted nucleic acid-binding protein
VILYLDTSSLIKLYLEEQGTAEVRQLVEAAEVLATSVIAYPEARSALARLHREGGLTSSELARVRSAFEQDWRLFLVLEVTAGIWRQAGDLAARRALRGFDSLHLASFLSLGAEQGRAGVEFSSHDDRLNEAARVESSR